MNKIKNFSLIISTAILVFMLISIYNNYNYKIQNKNLLEIYYNLTNAIKNKEKNSINFYSTEIFKNHKNTIQYDLCCLILAKENIKNNNDKDAKKYLKILLKNETSIFYDIANIRLIKILIENKKYNKALMLANNTKNNAYEVLYEEVKGDIFSNLLKKNDAINTYEKAYKKNNDKNYKKNILTYKIITNKIK